MRSMQLPKSKIKNNCIAHKANIKALDMSKAFMFAFIPID